MDYLNGTSRVVKNMQGFLSPQPQQSELSQLAPLRNITNLLFYASLNSNLTFPHFCSIPSFYKLSTWVFGSSVLLEFPVLATVAPNVLKTAY